ncbi:hypothetical protein [Taylorella equigenitalis]|uniref:Uncharacterized protein n=2 Tax=Taylorella equigenitalis TaxID=29575 RepID=A0A654KF83_TAYEM|nr:hypothetical protein [Taylorella equigenitalis]ADU91083.1 hypothetical protein TEQUI_0127 [Taylorella equigenitalis MCE9]AFN36187.1 hypothetical protein KUI_1122 [Taylorella equigenitalis ATCC 35865]ASY39592.1 hypothetical protein CA604_05630 [Taylorella equigenitalis]ASY42532.1 hypothetical protein CA943_05385 [Taylorella equigenitalis]KGK34101.1 hypothetical protein LW90_00625 [Taylorella equigenitalis]
MQITINNEKFDVDTKNQTITYDDKQYHQTGTFEQRQFTDSEGQKVDDDLNKKLTSALIRGYTNDKKAREKEHGGMEIKSYGDTFYVNTAEKSVLFNDEKFTQVGDFDNKKFIDSQRKEVNPKLEDKLKGALISAYVKEKEARERKNDGKEISLKGTKYYVNLDKGTIKSDHIDVTHKDDGFYDNKTNEKVTDKDTLDCLNFAENIIKKQERKQTQDLVM